MFNCILPTVSMTIWFTISKIWKQIVPLKKIYFIFRIIQSFGPPLMLAHMLHLITSRTDCLSRFLQFNLLLPPPLPHSFSYSLLLPLFLILFYIVIVVVVVVAWLFTIDSIEVNHFTSKYH